MLLVPTSPSIPESIVILTMLLQHMSTLVVGDFHSNTPGSEHAHGLSLLGFQAGSHIAEEWGVGKPGLKQSWSLTATLVATAKALPFRHHLVLTKPAANLDLLLGTGEDAVLHEQGSDLGRWQNKELSQTGLVDFSQCDSIRIPFGAA